VVEKSADGLIVLTRGGVVRFANSAVKTLFRREPEELIGRPLPFRLSPEGAVEIEILRRGGVKGTGEVHVTETEWEGAPALLASIRDISERKLAEQRLRDQTQALDAANAELKQANAELEKLSQLQTEFVSTVSHELRTPLTVIKTNIANLRNAASGPLTEAQKKWTQKIDHHCTRLDDLLGGILDLSKLESGRLETRREPTDVGPLIRQLAANLTALAKEKQIALSCQAPENLPWIYADPMRIEQVLTNLIVNALKFTQPKGSVLVSARQEKDCVQVSVSDNGPGVAPEHREAIFDRFRQIHGAGERRGSGGGIGLGLAICRQIISQHRGRIWVESDAGVGSNFIFQIPLETSNRILVADGDEATRRSVEELLSAKGYPVTACACGEEAIRLLSDPGRQFGLVFLELMFQDIGGVEVVKALHRRQPHVPIILLTGDTDRSLLFQAMTLSPLTVISKPFKGQDILDTVGKLLPKWRKS
ncbi:MAG: response regulator, partial [Elusimicrobia bacterium]|nr:response regulator [Elusimicrobiota bacterium]